MKKKTKLIIVIVTVLFILLFPIRLKYKDGGSTAYRSIVGIYEITDWNQMGAMMEGYETLKTGITIKLFGQTVLDNSKIKIVTELY